MQLPLLLAGPILRRVDPGLVAVQVALSEPADVELRVWEGRVAHDTTNPVFASSDDPPDPTRRRRTPARRRSGSASTSTSGWSRRGCHRRPARSSSPTGSTPTTSLITGAAGRGSDLARARAARHAHGQRRRGADRSATPTGCCRASPCPPTELDRPADRVRLVPPARATTTATRWPGWTSTSNERFGDPRARIHQLFLGGDQIYADDVDSVMMLRVVELGVELIGTRRRSGPPIERVKVDQVLRRPPATQPDPADPTAAYTPETAAGDRRRGRPAGRPPHFPVGRPAAT